MHPTVQLRAGSGLVQTGSRLAQGWHRDGSGLAKRWLRAGSDWHRDGSGMAQVWHRDGSGLAQGWHRDGSGLAQSWLWDGTEMAQGWLRDGTAGTCQLWMAETVPASGSLCSELLRFHSTSCLGPTVEGTALS